mgnify:CR=1 FL=1
MRCLNRNKQSFYYANYQGETKQMDASGYFTGEYAVTYSNPIQVYGNISPARGTEYESPFGITEGYDKVIVLSNPYFPISETSVLWIENDTTEAFDYVITKIARSLNSISIAIKKVDVDE